MEEVPVLLEQFREGADHVVAALADTQPAEIDHSPSPGAWSLRQIVAHLADAEIAAAWRFRRLIADPSPTLESFDEKLWAGNLAYDRRLPADSLKLFLALRSSNYDLLVQMKAEDFEKAGTHAERGRVTLQDMIRINVEHTENHAAQIRKVRNQFRATAPQPQ